MEGWIALGGLAVAFAGVITTYLRDRDARSAAYRTRVYDKQYDALGEIFPLLVEHNRAAGLLLWVQTFDGDEDAPISADMWQEIRNAQYGPTDDLRQAWQRATLIIPEGSGAAIEKYLSTYSRLSETASTPRGAIASIEAAYETAVQQMRRDLGTDPLTKANLRAMGVLARERDEGLRESYRNYDERLGGTRK
jgi:hypothetical protein